MESSQVSIPLCSENSQQHRFCSAIGSNLELTGSCMTAARRTDAAGPGMALVFSSQWLEPEEWFEVSVDHQVRMVAAKRLNSYLNNYLIYYSLRIEQQ